MEELWKAFPNYLSDNIKDHDGTPVLSMAAKNGDSNTVNFLINKLQNINS